MHTIEYPQLQEIAVHHFDSLRGFFQRDALERFVGLPPSQLEKAEGLEQLRAVENAIPILVLDAPHPAYGVDTPEDLQRVEEILRRENRRM